MSKVDDILDDELDPEDLDPTPRGGKTGRDTEPKKTSKFRRRLGIAVVATGLATLAGCLPDTGQPRTTSTCDEPASWCGATGAVHR